LHGPQAAPSQSCAPSRPPPQAQATCRPASQTAPELADVDEELLVVVKTLGQVVPHAATAIPSPSPRSQALRIVYLFLW
jgi:hypothetical protein